MTLPLTLIGHPACDLCPLHEEAISVGIPTRQLNACPPNPLAVLLFVGQNPGNNEDTHNKSFIGRSGDLLINTYIKGAHFDEECVIFLANTARCYTPAASGPKLRQYATCLPYLLDDIALISSAFPTLPLVIVTLGSPATQHVWAHYTSKKPKDWTLRKAFSSQGLSFPPSPPTVLFATYHPAYVLRENSHILTVQDHLQLVINFLSGNLATPSLPTIVPPGPPPYAQQQRPSASRPRPALGTPR